jgi:hypothetical protein
MMPCQSYESSWARKSDDYEIRQIKQEADRLARIACRALQTLEDYGQADFLLLKDTEVREWWTAHKEADRKAHAAAEAKRRREELRAAALAKLTEEERAALGIKTPRRKTGV